MIAVLFSPAGIAPYRLYVGVGIPADPYRRPRRRNYQRSDSFQRRFIPNRLVVRIQINEPGARPPPPDALTIRDRVAQTRRFGRFRFFVWHSPLRRASARKCYGTKARFSFA